MRPLTLLAFGGISVVIMAAVVVVLWSMGSSASAREPFTTLEIAPRDAELYIALNTEPSSPQWIAFANLLDTIDVEDPLRDAWNDLLSEEDLAWDDDIVSLLGDEGYAAITDFSALDDGHGFVGAFELRNPGEAEELFLRLATQAAEEDGSELLEEDYRGITVHYLEGDFDEFWSDEEYYYEEDYYFDEGESQEEDFSDFEESDDPFAPDDGSPARDSEVQDTGAIAFVDGTAVVGISRQDVQGGIDVLQGRAPNALDNPRLQEMRARQEEDFLLWGYVDLAEAWEALDEALQESAENEEDAQQFEESLNEARESADLMSFTVMAQSDGFVIDALVLQPPGAAATSDYLLDTAFETHYASEVPEDTLAFAAGYDLYHEIYEPAYDAIKDIELAPAYCADTFDASYYFPIGYDERDDPVYGQFYDEDGNINYDAYEQWYTDIENFFTTPEGDFDYEAYNAYFESLYDKACQDDTQTVDEAVAEFEQDVGFDLEDDLIALLTGEFAVAFNASNFDADEPDFAVLGLLDVADTERMQSSLDKLADYIVGEGDWTSTVDTETGVRRLSPDASGTDEEYPVAWAVEDGTLSAGYPDEPVSDFVAGLDGPSLADSGDWQRMMELLPEQRTFVAYVSLARVVEELEDVEDPNEELDDLSNGEVTIDDLRPIRSVGLATSNVEGGWTLRVAVLIDE
jgi:hypothetical protein